MKIYYPLVLLNWIAWLPITGNNVQNDRALSTFEKQVPRVIITSDLNTNSGDPDDKQSMAHLFMYADEVEIKSIIPDRWNAHGVEATMICIEAYEKDYHNPAFNYQKFNFPTPDYLRSIVQKNPEDAVNSIIAEARKDDPRPLHVLVWGNMKTIRDALFKAPEIASKIRIYTIGTNLMAENPDAATNSKSTIEYGKRPNWNGSGRNDIFNDPRFDQLWWLENDWAYNGMFEGEAPGEFLREIKEYGVLGHYIWDCVQDWKWAHYFRAGDTPSLLYLLEPGADIDNPGRSSWAGKFTQPFPKERPNYWIDEAGNEAWNYKDPSQSWDLVQSVYQHRVQTLVDRRDEMYASYRNKMKKLYSSAAVNQSEERLRTLVLTDIENEPDDAQSLVRFLTYANQWDIEGLIATTSYWKKTSIADWRIYEILEAYKKVQPNLAKHEEGYPTYEELKAKVKKGLPEYGMGGVGDGKDSEGSDWIIQTLEKPDDRPLWVQVWGGSNCLAQALWKIRQSRSPAEAEALYKKLRVYTISDQDDSGPWIRKTFPDIFYICTPGYEHDGAGGYHYATWSGISGDIFHGRFPGANREVIGKEWLKNNIQIGHGPLGEEYPDVEFLMEGDTPSYLHLIPNGLNNPEHPNYGGWGGRYEYYLPKTEKWFFEPETRPLWTNAVDEFYSPWDNQHHTTNHVTIWRWREEFQHDFAARMDWCVKDYEEANHPPVPALGTKEHLTARSGDAVVLQAVGSTDPDGDNLSYQWFHYREPGTYKGAIKLEDSAAAEVSFVAPKVSHPQTAHFILKVTDDGEPALTRYKRVIVSILP